MRFEFLYVRSFVVRRWNFRKKLVERDVVVGKNQNSSR